MEISPFLEQSQRICNITLENMESSIFDVANSDNHHQDFENNNFGATSMAVSQSEHSTNEKGPKSDYVQSELVNIDLTDNFTTDKIFESREELIRWAARTAREAGCTVVIKKSDHAVSGRTPRVESAHAKLKRHVGKCSMFDFVGLWKVMHLMINEQITEIRVSFERSLNSVKHEHRILILKEVKGFVSREAIDLILSERKHAFSMGLDADACMCILHSTHGLPCAHEIAIYDHDKCPIPLSSIHSFWKKLSGIPTLRDRGDLDNYPEFQMFVKHYEESDDVRKKYLLKKLKELADSATSWLVEPQEDIETEDQPKGSKQRKLLQIESSS
ncbi:hypothetical protein FRX31_028095 [Thalictrum thalictroides]|uniref:SWIM-type domain-containing protein n=1 Tax=Thalictrum thalictroides TaxID=46969 RepID=A0A7J6VDN2_THATH|nr:hypothetical protein FRX31_028095 [Thalictrum thalictroides]